ncbi:hypothetical protein Hanom_Chr10g00922451 [Helianthus anomalus]
MHKTGEQLVNTSYFWHCPLAQKLTDSVLYVAKSCKFCPFSQTRLDFLVKSSHVNGT